MSDPPAPAPAQPASPPPDIYGKKGGDAGAWDKDRAAGANSGPRPPDPAPPAPAAPPSAHTGEGRDAPKPNP